MAGGTTTVAAASAHYSLPGRLPEQKWQSVWPRGFHSGWVGGGGAGSSHIHWRGAEGAVRVAQDTLSLKYMRMAAGGGGFCIKLGGGSMHRCTA